ncbi:MAG: DUF1559 domain-containing protein [Anaerolineae bacterium]
MKRRAFTLIELLVVIAIIAILAAILFPVFAKAREKARQSACLSNVKQMAFAVHSYMNDWDNSYPSSARYPTPDPKWDNVYGYGFWMWLIQPYLKTYDVSRCPSAPHNKPVWLPENSPYPVANYGYNEYIVYCIDREFNIESNIPLPTQTALIADCFNAALFHDWGENEDDNTNWTKAPDRKRLPSGILRIKYANGNGGVPGGTLKSRHEGSNIVYCDAHAAFMPVGRFDAVNWTGEPTQRMERPIIHPLAKPMP